MVRYSLLSFLLVSCAPEPESPPYQARGGVERIPLATVASRTDELCDGKDNDGDGTVDEDCGHCEMLVSRAQPYWAASTTACVLNGRATPYALLPQTAGGTNYTTAVQVRTFLSATTGTPLIQLKRQILVAKLNRAAFLTGSIEYSDWDGDGSLETVDELIAFADAVYTSGTATERSSMLSLLNGMNAAGTTLTVWYSCASTPEICDGGDNDGDGSVDENCGCYEACDGYDNDSDGVVDDGWPDGDADAYAECDDCDDADPSVFPDATEACNGIDDNCDGVVDEGVTSTFFVDADGDGYGDASASTSACSAAAGYSSVGTDCDDSSSSINPGATETRDDGIDQDCSGADLPYTWSYATNIQPIWNARCTSCHNTVGGDAGLELAATKSYAELVNVASTQLSSMDRIEPGSPSTSYVFHKISGTQATVGGSGSRMPSSGSALTSTQISTISTWISEGAPNN